MSSLILIPINPAEDCVVCSETAFLYAGATMFIHRASLQRKRRERERERAQMQRNRQIREIRRLRMYPFHNILLYSKALDL